MTKHTHYPVLQSRLSSLLVFSKCSDLTSASLAHTLYLSLRHGAFTQLLILFSSAHMTTHTHTHLNGVMAGSLEIWGWMRLDGDCPTYRCYPSPQTGRGRGLPLCSLPVSSALSVLTGWHVHSCLLPPAAVYSKAHTFLWLYRFNFCHFTSVSSWIWSDRRCLHFFAGC